jgi:hypothetical protein
MVLENNLINYSCFFLVKNHFDKQADNIEILFSSLFIFKGIFVVLLEAKT